MLQLVFGSIISFIPSELSGLFLEKWTSK